MAEHPLDLDGLVAALDAKRHAEGISWRELARQADVSPSTLTRMQQGKRPDVDTFSALMRWLAVPAEHFLGGQKLTDDELSPSATFAALMRSKRVKKLSADRRETLDALLEAAIRILKEPKREPR